MAIQIFQLPGASPLLREQEILINPADSGAFEAGPTTRALTYSP